MDKNKKQLLILIISSIFLLAVIGAINRFWPQIQVQAIFYQDNQRLAGIKYEIAKTSEQMKTGLMHRESMPANHGMIFIFDNEKPRTFWMKNTLIPLDIIYLDKNKTIVSIQKNAKPCELDPCELYPSKLPAQYVIEVNAGFVDKYQIEPGNQVKF